MADNEASLLLRIKQTGGEVLDHFVVTLGDVAEAAKKVGEFLYSFIEAWDKQEKAVNSLTQVMVQNGIYTTDLRQKYEEMATAIQKTTTYGDEQVIAAQATLQAYTGQRQVTKELVQATVDLATAKKMDLNSAAELVGKSLSQYNNILKRQGVEYEQTTDKAERMTRVVDAIEQKFGGQAAAAAQGLGSIQQLKNAYSDFQENVGQRLAPALSLLVQWLTHLFEVVGKGGVVMDAFVAVVQGVSQQAIMFARDFEVVGKVIGNVLAGIVGTVQNMIEGNWKEAWNSAKSIVTVSADDIAKANETMKDRIQATNKAFLEGVDGDLNREAELEKQSLEKRKNYREAFDEELAKKQLEKEIARQDSIVKEQEMEGMVGDQKIAAQIAVLDKQISLEESYAQKRALVKQRASLIEDQKEAIRKKQQLQTESLFQNQRVEMIGAASDLITALGDSESKAVFLIQKAAALAQTWIATQVAAAQTLASVPYPANIAAAENIETIGYIRMGAIAATAIKGLAEGGIVPATSGGGLYRIGEGGRDEAVIPLDDPKTQQRLGGMGGMTVNFYGSFLGDENQAMEVAKVLDRAFLKLRQQNQSVAFETDVV